MNPDSRDIKSQSDLIGSAIVGVFIGVLFVVTARLLLGGFVLQEFPGIYFLLLVALIPVLSVFGMIIVIFFRKLLGARATILSQFYKFALVGALNTFIDLTVLNGLIVVSGMAGGWQFSVFKGISFVVAVINSYLWNKLWTFRRGEGRGVMEFSQFLIISIVGLGVNVGAASFVINIISPPEGVSAQIWANFAAISAVAFSMIWNFVGYKFFVFKKR